MIYDRLENIGRYVGLSATLDAGLSFAQQADATLKPGRHEVVAGCFANVNRYRTTPIGVGDYESHEKYADIQFLLDGEELVRVAPVSAPCLRKAYDADRDVAFYAEEGSPATELRIGNGWFAVFFPGEVHIPQICAGEEQEVLKVVVKVAVNE